MKKEKLLKKCDNCPDNIGETPYCSKQIPGEYCSTDCYVDAFMDIYGIDGLRGKFTVIGDGHGGVELND